MSSCQDRPTMPLALLHLTPDSLENRDRAPIPANNCRSELNQPNFKSRITALVVDPDTGASYKWAYPPIRTQFCSGRLPQVENKSAVTPTSSSSPPGAAMCVWCKGTGADDGKQCLACQGKGVVSVKQPPTKCKRCGGTGVEIDRITYTSPRCADCGGSGWEGASRR